MSEGYHSTLEWGFWKFIKYLVTVFVVAWVTSWLLTRFANLDVLTWNWLVAVHLANLWLFIPEAVAVLGTFAIIKLSRASEKRKRFARWKRLQTELANEAGGD